MLPGLRFLLAAIALSMSILVFGLGAAALLRAAHEEFASIPSWRAAPETIFAAPSETTPPVLAMLRVEPPNAEQTTAGHVPTPPETTSEPTATVSPPAEQEMTKPELEAAQAPNPDETAPAPADVPAPIADTNVEATRIAANEAVAPVNKPTSAAVSPGIASTKIATLGGPSVVIEVRPADKLTPPKPDKDAIKKRLQAQRAILRRRIAARARLAQQAPPQPVDPFAQPTTQPAVTARKH
ncbi:MAG TPA: hypothetical protein VFH41_02825 [Bradyrhizobium sp.]|nr:hypothetical protein [Bradyrhizobium sp.]